MKFGKKMLAALRGGTLALSSVPGAGAALFLRKKRA